MKVREAKKKLKAEMDRLHPTIKAYIWVKWVSDKKLFIVDTLHGQRRLISF